MQLTLFEHEAENPRASSFGKTYLEPYRPETMLSDAFWLALPARICHYSRQGANGRTRVVCMVPKEQSRGGFSIPNISAWPNDATVCSLSQVLEPSVPQKYFLSAKAAAGILRRAEKRAKILPDTLRRALLTAAATQADASISPGA